MTYVIVREAMGYHQVLSILYSQQESWMVIAKRVEGYESIKYEADPEDSQLTHSNSCRGEAKILGCPARATAVKHTFRYERVLIISSTGSTSQAHQKTV